LFKREALTGFPFCVRHQDDKNSRHTAVYKLYELFSSMRFAIGLLTILAIASIIGTVLKQNEPYPNYAFEFGQYWFAVFEQLGLYDVYHSGWFLTILAFLVLSTTLCIVRNGPGFIKDMKAYREKASDNSLAAMKHSVVFDGTAADRKPCAPTCAARAGAGANTSVQTAAWYWRPKGAASKLGYFFAHIALVVICIGGLMDGNLPLKLAEMVGSVVPETRDIPQSQIPPQSRLSTSNLSFRGNVTVAEGKSADVVFLNSGNGYLVQDLPFTVTLKKFYVDYYSNGMPKLFASDIAVTDKATGKVTEAQVKVNHPLIVDGVAIYQASFGDGGSPLTFKAWNLTSRNAAGGHQRRVDGRPAAARQWQGLQPGVWRSARVQHREHGQQECRCQWQEPERAHAGCPRGKAREATEEHRPVRHLQAA
jgi:cytochrome c biogenesis protein